MHYRYIKSRFQWFCRGSYTYCLLSFFSYEILKSSPQWGPIASRWYVLSQHICQTCGQALPEGKNIPGTSSVWLKLNTHWTLGLIYILNVNLVSDTHYVRIIPVYWSRLGRNSNGTNGYSPTYFSSLISLKVLYLKLIYVFINVNPPFWELMQQLNWKWRCQWVYSRCNYKLDKVTSKVNICSVRVPLVPTWWRHLLIHSNLLCYYAVSFWPITEQFPIHSFQ